MFFLKLLLIVVYVAGVIKGVAERPSNLPCRLNDVECITKAADWIVSTTVQGIPEKGIQSLDPFYHETIDGNLGYLRYTLMKSTLEGMKSCKVNKASFKGAYTSISLELHCRRNHMRGLYNTEGALLGYPIKGEGRYNIDTTNFFCVFNADVKFYKKNNKIHTRFEKHTYKCDLLGELDVDVRTLDENKKKTSDIAHNMIRLAKENAKLFTNLVDKPIHVANSITFVNNLNKRLELESITDILQVNEKILAGKL